MKTLTNYIVATFILVAMAGTAAAQKTISIEEPKNDQIKTLFKNNRSDGFYGSFSVGYSPIDEKHGMTFSSRGSWIIDHSFAIGVGGTGFVNAIEDFQYMDNADFSDGDLNLAGGYGGLIFEPIIAPLFPIHVSFPVLIGVGGVASFDNYYYSSYYDVAELFFVVEPMVELELNLTRWMRIAAYASYRYTSELSIENVASDALRNYSTGITMKFGMF